MIIDIEYEFNEETDRIDSVHVTILKYGIHQESLPSKYFGGNSFSINQYLKETHGIIV